MKVLLVIFAICINYTLGEGTTQVKVYPKKYRSYSNGKILINAAKYDKGDNPPVARSYTAFQMVGSNPKLVLADVPDSPYFPVEQGYDQKARVKKVLPLEYPWSILRNKRSAVLNVSSAEKDDKKVEAKPMEVEKVKETTPMPTAAAAETTTMKSSSPKEVQEESKSTTEISTTETSTTKAKAHNITNIERMGAKPAKKNNPVRKGKSQPKSKATPKKNNPVRKGKSQPKSKAKPKKNNLVRKGKSQLKSKAAPKKNNPVRKGKSQPKSKAALKKSKPKGKGAAVGRAKPKGKQNKSVKKSKRNTQKNQKQKANPNKARAGKTPKDTRRLISAREALIEDYPYVVSIQKDDQHWCSGALLNERMVITTANCLWKANHVSRMEVRAGSRYTNRGGQMASIQEVLKHPGWGLRKNPDYDVALLLLDTFIKFSDSVHAVDLPNRVMMPAFDDAWITSWGSERRDGVYDNYDSTSLQVYHARLIDRQKCNNVTMRFSVVVTENFICLAQSGRQAPCTRDTGAPAVSDGILWGLASWGLRKLCGTERFPAVFSYLASHSNMEFIMNATRLLMSDKRQYPFADRYPKNLISRK